MSQIRSLSVLKIIGKGNKYSQIFMKTQLLKKEDIKYKVFQTIFFQMDLTSFLDKSKSECLNESDDHPYAHCLTPGGGFLESDCDEQLILALTFNQAMKVHSLKIKAPSDKGPKTIRIFQNQPNTLDFDKADSMVSIQDIE